MVLVRLDRLVCSLIQSVRISRFIHSSSLFTSRSSDLGSHLTTKVRRSLILGSAVVAIIVMIGLAWFLFFSQNPSSPNFAGKNSTTSKSADGLSLVLSLNSTIMQSGQGISVILEEQNTLPKVNDVSASTNWPLNGLKVSPCGPLNYPIGVAIFQGYYVAANISSAKPLQLYEPGVYACPMILAKIDAYAFQPLSSTASVIGSCGPSSCFTERIYSNVTANGYWNEGLLEGATFTPFNPGAYTVVAGDEWGALAVLHFFVEQYLP